MIQDNRLQIALQGHWEGWEATRPVEVGQDLPLSSSELPPLVPSPRPLRCFLGNTVGG